MRLLPSPSDLGNRSVFAPAPVPLTSFIGREREKTFALDLLRRTDIRLLTLTGPGGIGKTRLAIEISNETSELFADGVHFVLLAAVDDADLVLPAIIRSLGVRTVDSVADRDLLVRALRDAQAMLVLDNFEQVLDASPIVSDVLAACPMLKIMVTSRSLLRIAGEQALPVPPLTVLAPEVGGSISDLLDSPAVRLFTERARAVTPSFDINNDNGATVASICQHLDGLPLAIEIAAAQTLALPPSGLLTRIRSRMPLPVTGLRDAPARHRTMRDAIAWSYDLLSVEEQILIRRSGIFSDGFSLEAVEYVYGRVENSAYRKPDGATDRNLQIAILSGITSLVEKSLVRQVGREGEPRFNMLETIQSFALEELGAAGELDAVSDAHASWFLEFATQRERAALLPGGDEQLLQLEIEHANLRSAMALLAQREKHELLLQLVAALGGFWYGHSHYWEGRGWLTRALAASTSGATNVRAKALAELGRLISLQGDYARADDLLSEAVAILSEGVDATSTAIALVWHGANANHREEHEQAERILHRALNLVSTIDDPELAATVASIALANLGIAAHGRGELGIARERHEQSLLTSRQNGYRLGVIRSLRDLGDVARDEGHFADALAFYRDCLSMMGDQGDLRVVADALEGAGIAAAAWHQTRTASRLLGAAEEVREQIGAVLFAVPADRVAHERALAALRKLPGADNIETDWLDGRQLPLASAIAEVNSISPELAETDVPNGADAVSLSPREREVLDLLVDGRTNRVIAEALFISERTVENHVSHLLAKLGVRTRTGAVSAAIAAGIIEPLHRHRSRK